MESKSWILGAGLLVTMASCDASNDTATSSYADAGLDGDSGEIVAHPCTPRPLCTLGAECLALKEYGGSSAFTLRMSALEFTAPGALLEDDLPTTVTGGVTPRVVACNLFGLAKVVWLLQFDTDAATLKTGIARPVADEVQGYQFMEQPIDQGGKTFAIHPVVFHDLSFATDGQFSVQTGQDIFIPIFLDYAGDDVVVLPLRDLRVEGTVSLSHDCIGHYNMEGLASSPTCQPSSGHPAFITGASIRGYVSLKEADEVPVGGLGKSLCALLTRHSQEGAPFLKCRRTTAGRFRDPGDWCVTTNAAATRRCADAFLLRANFAASGVRIDN